jgi:hypothetical protein
MTGTDLELYEENEARALPATLIPADSPEEFLTQAGHVAKALVEVVEKRNLFTQIGRKKHIHVEAWTTLGSLLGSVGGKSVYAVPDGDPEPVEIDGVKGVKSRVRAVTIDGAVVGGATGYCMRDEPTWKNRPFYALAGMAETRATSRALRKPLGFIVELAGYSATAAEEMPRDVPAGVAAVIEAIEDGELADTPFAPSAFQPPPGAAAAVDDREPKQGGATKAQLSLIYVLIDKCEKKGVTEATLRDQLELQHQTRHFSELPKGKVSEVIDALKVTAGES